MPETFLALVRDTADLNSIKIIQNKQMLKFFDFFDFLIFFTKQVPIEGLGVSSNETLGFFSLKSIPLIYTSL